MLTDRGALSAEVETHEASGMHLGNEPPTRIEDPSPPEELAPASVLFWATCDMAGGSDGGMGIALVTGAAIITAAAAAAAIRGLRADGVVGCAFRWRVRAVAPRDLAVSPLIIIVKACKECNSVRLYGSSGACVPVCSM